MNLSIELAFNYVINHGGHGENYKNIIKTSVLDLFFVVKNRLLRRFYLKFY